MEGGKWAGLILSVAAATAKIDFQENPMHANTILLIVAGFALVLNCAYSSPINIPTAKTIQATNNDKLHELKTQAENHLSSKAKMPKILDKGSKLEDASAPASADASSSESESTGDDDTESKANFWYVIVFSRVLLLWLYVISILFSGNILLVVVVLRA